MCRNFVHAYDEKIEKSEVTYAKRKDQHSRDEHRREGDDDLECGGHAAQAVFNLFRGM